MALSRSCRRIVLAFMIGLAVARRASKSSEGGHGSAPPVTPSENRTMQLDSRRYKLELAVVALTLLLLLVTAAQALFAQSRSTLLNSNQTQLFSKSSWRALSYGKDSINPCTIGSSTWIDCLLNNRVSHLTYCMAISLAKK
jgi:hypothetical protein